jgi:hypothetical protein
MLDQSTRTANKLPEYKILFVIEDQNLALDGEVPLFSQVSRPLPGRNLSRPSYVPRHWLLQDELAVARRDHSGRAAAVDSMEYLNCF